MAENTQDGTNPIYSLVRRLENNFINGNNLTSKYVEQSPYEDINRIIAYLSSKHISGSTDSKGREKPFFNVTIASRNITFRATDLDRKNIKIKATKIKEVLGAFIASIFLQNWMKKFDFGRFLNSWGLTQAGFNEAVVKFVEQDGELYSSVIPWDRIIFDSIDFANNPKIEKLEFTPSQLRQKTSYNQEIVSNLIDTLESRKTIGRNNKDSNKSDYVTLYEIHGNLPLSYLTGKDKDLKTYTQQMHVISFVAGKGKGEYDDFTLYCGKEEKDPYMLTSLMPEVDGSVQFNGTVKNLFDTQWMINHSTKQAKDLLDISSMVFYQTSDANLVAQNALDALMNGDILIHAPNQPLTQVQTNSNSIVSIQTYMNQWRVLGQEITSTPDIMMGNNMPSGTAYRQAAIIQQESHSNFEIMTENKGIDVEKMLRTYIIPFLKKKLKNKDEIVAELDEVGIKKIDSMYINTEASNRTNKSLIEKALNGEMVNPEMQSNIMQKNISDVKSELSQQGDKRFLVPSEISDKTWNDIFKDLEWEVECEITGESSDKQTILTTLSELMGTIAKNPAVLQDPTAKMLFNKILTESNIVSPLEIQEQQTQQLPTQGGVGGNQIPEVIQKQNGL